MPRRDVPRFKVNDEGWPSISKAPFGSATDGPMNWNSLFGKKGSGSARFELNDLPELRVLIEYVVNRDDLRAESRV
jgi:hypothetical protein